MNKEFKKTQKKIDAFLATLTPEKRKKIQRELAEFEEKLKNGTFDGFEGLEGFDGLDDSDADSADSPQDK